MPALGHLLRPFLELRLSFQDRVELPPAPRLRLPENALPVGKGPGRAVQPEAIDRRMAGVVLPDLQQLAMFAGCIFDGRAAEVGEHQQVVSRLGKHRLGVALLRQGVGFRSQVRISVALRSPARQEIQKRKVPAVFLLLRQRVLQYPGPEAGARVLVVPLHQIENAAIVERHGALIGLAAEGLAVFCGEGAARLFRLLIAGVNRLNGQQRLVERLRCEVAMPQLHRRKAGAQQVQYPVPLALCNHS